MASRRLALGVLISGSGTNLQAIMDASAAGRLDADVVVVVSDNEDAYGLERARAAGVPAVWVDPMAHGSRRAYNEALRDILHAHGVDVVAMAGYMRLLGAEVLDAFPGQVLNIHPSLLPAFSGPDGIREAFEYGVKVTGVTVHVANERFDEGPILMQGTVEIEDDDTLESLAAKIHEVEHRLYPAALQLLADGRISVEGRKARIEPV